MTLQYQMPKKENSRSNLHKAGNQANRPEDQKEAAEENFTLYTLLEVDKKATKEQIKKQYRKLVLQYHPDKNRQDPLARQKFQKLKEAYDILIDDEKRQQYDETGTVGDDFNQNTFQSAYDYFRKIYRKVTPEDINSFSQQYREGPMEKQDLLDYYQSHQGSMVELIQCIPLSTNQDIPRFINFFKEQIDSKKIPVYKAFQKTKNKVRLLVSEQKQFEEEQKKSLGSLILAIQSKADKKFDYIASLEQKYGVGKKHKIEKEESNKQGDRKKQKKQKPKQ